MDIYEQIVELRRQGRRGAVATITNVRGSIPSFQTAKMLVRDDGSIVGTIGGGCVEAEVWQAAREVIAEDFEAATAHLDPPESSYIVIVTRGHRDDMRLLRWAVNTRARYLGMIGSKRKTISIYKELEKEGIPAEKFANVHAPVGLEIGAVTPEEIAVSIVAEMIAVRRHASANVSSKTYSHPGFGAEHQGKGRRWPP